MSALLRWTTFCVVTGRKMRLDTDMGDYFAVADDPDRSYREKLSGYRALADRYFEVDRYWEFCDKHLTHVDEVVYEWVTSEEFRSLLRETVREIHGQTSA